MGQFSKPSRRTLVKGAAWSVPVVAVAQVAPAFAASPVKPPVEPSFTSNFCKHPGNPKYYHSRMKWINHNPTCTVTINLGNFCVGTDCRQAQANIDNRLVTQFTLLGGQTRCMHADAGQFKNSANGGAVLNYTWIMTCPGQTPTTGSGQVLGGTLIDNSLSPCGTGGDTGGNPGGQPPHGNINC
ncbi:hypothetical protein [Ornithinimicrobium sp. Y1694]|uniref:hypothetical protein n=1 Tax=Ornithinimicrobium sp. Y1694 TaxID=3418590 RepID=UPI003CF56A2F